MDQLKKNNKEAYKKQFNKWDAALTKAKATNLEAVYKTVHKNIRANPKRVKAEKKQAPVRKQISKEKGGLVLQNSKGKKWLRQ